MIHDHDVTAGAPPSELDRTTADSDQGLAAFDQTASDHDQTAAERDEADAAGDQLAADGDQVRADLRPPAAGDGTAEAYEASRSVRQANKLSRLATNLARARTARFRAQNATERDAIAAARDETARRRDMRTASFERFLASSDSPLADQLAQVRASSAEARLLAARDRDSAARDRAKAAIDRTSLEADLAGAHMDDDTGAFGREAGTVALAHEIDRARRANSGFVLAFIQVDRVRVRGDPGRPRAGDPAARRLVETIRSGLRPFDLIARYRADAFLCGLGGIETGDVARLFDAICWSLRTDIDVDIEVGLARLEDGETLDVLITRAAADAQHAGSPAAEPG